MYVSVHCVLAMRCHQHLLLGMQQYSVSHLFSSGATDPASKCVGIRKPLPSAGRRAGQTPGNIQQALVHHPSLPTWHVVPWSVAFGDYEESPKGLLHPQPSAWCGVLAQLFKLSPVSRVEGSTQWPCLIKDLWLTVAADTVCAHVGTNSPLLPPVSLLRHAVKDFHLAPWIPPAPLAHSGLCLQAPLESAVFIF